MSLLYWKKLYHLVNNLLIINPHNILTWFSRLRRTASPFKENGKRALKRLAFQPKSPMAVLGQSGGRKEKKKENRWRCTFFG